MSKVNGDAEMKDAVQGNGTILISNGGHMVKAESCRFVIFCVYIVDGILRFIIKNNFLWVTEVV